MNTGRGPLTLIINTEAIDRDAEKRREELSPSGLYVGCHLSCMRDQRTYDEEQIKSMCLSECKYGPHYETLYPSKEPECWKEVFEQPSSDGTPYMTVLWKNNKPQFKIVS